MKAVMYHYVRPATGDLPYFRYLHVGDFERQLDWFASRERFVTPDDMALACETGRAPDGAILTFDDGLADHYEHVLPILRERGICGFFYVSTSPYETGRLLDVHRIHLLLGRMGGNAALQLLKNHLEGRMLGDAHVNEFHESTYKNQDNDRATTSFKRILNYLISYEHRRVLLDGMFAVEFGDEGPVVQNFYLSPAQIVEMDQAGMVIGSHGVNHYVFSKLSEPDQRQEITRSFDYLSTLLGKQIQTFCYPYGGRHSFTAQTTALLDSEGAAYSFDVNPRDATDEDFSSARQALPRYDCNMFPHGRASFGSTRAQQAA